MGYIYKRGKTFWIKYYRGGRPFRESSGSRKRADAERLLKEREGSVAKGLPVVPNVEKTKFYDLLQDLIVFYEVHKYRTIDSLERRIRLHIEPFFRNAFALSIRPDHIMRFIVKRQKEGASNAEVNRELSAVLRAFSLGIENQKILHRPKISLLPENNIRQGFFEREQFEAVRRHLTASLQAVVTFAYLTGWRVRSEILTLQWVQVDLKLGRVVLHPGTTKNEDARMFPFTDELRQLLEEQWDVTQSLQQDRGIICPWVFHRNGKPIKSFYTAWHNACKKAGLPGRIPHDFRRTAVRNLIRAGVPELVAMQLTGHRSRSVFRRYHIIVESDLVEAAQKLDQAAKSYSSPISRQ